MHDEKFEDAAMEHEREQQWEHNQRRTNVSKHFRVIWSAKLKLWRCCPIDADGYWQWHDTLAMQDWCDAQEALGHTVELVQR